MSASYETPHNHPERPSHAEETSLRPQSEKGAALILVLMLIFTVSLLGLSIMSLSQIRAEINNNQVSKGFLDVYADALLQEMRLFIYENESEMDRADETDGFFGNNDDFVNIFDRHYHFRGDDINAPLEPIPNGSRDRYQFYIVPYPLERFNNPNFDANPGQVESTPWIVDSREFETFRFHDGNFLGTLEGIIFPEGLDMQYEIVFEEVSGIPGTNVEIVMFENNFPVPAAPSTNFREYEFPDVFRNLSANVYGVAIVVTSTNTYTEATAPTLLFNMKYRYVTGYDFQNDQYTYSDFQTFNSDLVEFRVEYDDDLGAFVWPPRDTPEGAAPELNTVLTRELRIIEDRAIFDAFPKLANNDVVFDQRPYTLVVRAKGQGVGKTVEARVAKRTFQDYSFFIENDSLRFEDFTEVFGKIYSRGDLDIFENNLFFNRVITSGRIKNVRSATAFEPTPLPVSELIARNFATQPSQNASVLDYVSRSDFDAGITKVNTTTNPTAGGWLASDDLTDLNFNLSNLVYVRDLNAPNGFRAFYRQGPLQIPLPRNFNGVVYFEDGGDDEFYVNVEGHLHGGKGVTVYSDGDIRIKNHITKGWGGVDASVGSATNPTHQYPEGIHNNRRPQSTAIEPEIHPVSVGLAADRNIIIARTAPKILRIQAAMYARQGKVMARDEDPVRYMSRFAVVNDPATFGINEPEYYPGVANYETTETLIAAENGNTTTLSDRTNLTPLRTRDVAGGASPQDRAAASYFHRPMHLRMLNRLYHVDGTAKFESGQMRDGANYKMLVPDWMWIDVNGNGIRDDIRIDDGGDVEGDMYGIWFSADPNATTFDVERDYVYVPIVHGKMYDETYTGLAGTNPYIPLYDPATFDFNTPTVFTPYGHINTAANRVTVDYQTRVGDIPAIAIDMDMDGRLEPEPFFPSALQNFLSDGFPGRVEIPGVGVKFTDNSPWLDNINPLTRAPQERQIEHMLDDFINFCYGNRELETDASTAGYNEWAITPYTFCLQIQGVVITNRQLSADAWINASDEVRWAEVYPDWTNGAPETPQTPPTGCNAVFGNRHWSWFELPNSEAYLGTPQATVNESWNFVAGRNDMRVLNNSLGCKTRIYVPDRNIGDFPPPEFPKPLKAMENITRRDTDLLRDISRRIDERFDVITADR